MTASPQPSPPSAVKVATSHVANSGAGPGIQPQVIVGQFHDEVELGVARRSGDLAVLVAVVTGSANVARSGRRSPSGASVRRSRSRASRTDRCSSRASVPRTRWGTPA